MNKLLIVLGLGVMTGIFTFSGCMKKSTMTRAEPRTARPNPAEICYAPAIPALHEVRKTQHIPPVQDTSPVHGLPRALMIQDASREGLAMVPPAAIMPSDSAPLDPARVILPGTPMPHPLQHAEVLSEEVIQNPVPMDLVELPRTPRPVARPTATAPRRAELEGPELWVTRSAPEVTLDLDGPQVAALPSTIEVTAEVADEILAPAPRVPSYSRVQPTLNESAPAIRAIPVYHQAPANPRDLEVMDGPELDLRENEVAQYVPAYSPVSAEIISSVDSSLEAEIHETPPISDLEGPEIGWATTRTTGYSGLPY